MEQPDQLCALCGGPIDIGEAWMEADEAGARKVAHSGCVYREETDPDRAPWWVPSEYGPNE